MGKGRGGFGGGFGGNMQQMMQQAKRLQEEMQKAQEELKATEFTGSASGMVEITINGDNQLLSVKIKPEAVDPDDVEMLEDLIAAAFGDAQEQLAKKTEEVMGPYSSLMGGLR